MEAITQKLRLEAHEAYSYVPRTGENARGADVTVAFAVDFTTAGERLTKREAGERFVAIPYGEAPESAADTLVKVLSARKGNSLNVAGNGVYTLAAQGVTQSQANQWVFEVLSRVHARSPLSSVRSGGQTGIDQAGLVAALALGIPAYGLYPKSFRRRNAAGDEVHSTAVKLERELWEQADKLERPRTRRFHPDGSLPKPGAKLVFGSNLAGRHGKGSALLAREQYGAIYGQGEGLQGDSYAIPTKDGRPGTPALREPAATLPVEAIREAVNRFINFAKEHPDMDFHVVRLGCDLAAHTNEVIAPLFDDAPDNCSFPDPWSPYMRGLPALPAPAKTADAVNLWSGARGIGGALTNMSERAREKGCIKHSYPVVINGVHYKDSEEAYQTLKFPGDDDYNDGLMIDIISLKFLQNHVLLDWVTKDGGVAWLEKCSHFTGAKSPRAQSWEGQGYDSRFIRNLVHGYQKAVTGRGPVTRVVHVKEAPYDVYIGRAMGQSFTESLWANKHRVGDLSREDAVAVFNAELEANPMLLAQVGQLKGRTLGCWCKSRESRSLLCHGDVLVARAEGKPWVAPQPAQASLF